jgi:hypothetical protein
MATVRVLTTGRMEQKALHTSLQAVFPDHAFVAHERLDGFTGAPLPPNYEELARRPRLRFNIDKFINTIVGLFAPGGRRPRPDYVLAIEDLELVNADAPERVVSTVRDAIGRNLSAWPVDGAARERLRADLRERCSFHLMAPMTEAYFFADASAFARATAPGPDHPVVFDAGACDVEAFSVDDPPYLAPANDTDIAWHKDNRRRHPKHYLEYLTDPALDGRSRYDEVTTGAAALASLAWERLVSTTDRPPAHLRFARSMLVDLHDMLGDAPSGDPLAQLDPRHCHPLTWPPGRSPVLRNL